MKRRCHITGVLLFFLLSLCSSGQQVHIPGRGPINTALYQTQNGDFFNRNYRVTSCTSDSIVLTRQSQIDSFPITNPACTVLRKLKIDGSAAIPAITRLDSLRYITQVSEELNISDIGTVNLSGLSGLTLVGGEISIQSCYSMTELGFPAAIDLDQVTNLLLSGLPLLTNISILTNKVRNNHPGNILIFGTGLTSLSGLDSLHHTDFLSIETNPRLQSLHGLEGLSSVSFYCNINDNDSLINLSGLNNLDSMVYSGFFECSDNDMLTNLSGLSNLSYLEGGMWIQGNNSLTSLSALNPSLFIHDFGADSVKITNNPLLAVCGSPPICNFLNNATTVRIENNAAGCNSIAEVQVSCNTCVGGVLKTWNGNINTNWDDSLNWTPAGVPGVCDSVLIPSAMPRYPSASSHITISGLRMTRGSHMDMNLYNFTVNGNITLDSAGIGSGQQFTINAPVNPYIDSSLIYTHQFTITKFTGGLHLIRNYILGDDVNISDSTSRSGTATIAGNTITGNFVVTANSTDTAAIINVSVSQGDAISGNTTFNINAPSHVNVGSASQIFYTGGNVIINSNFVGCPFLRNIDFTNTSTAKQITQAGSAPIHIYDAHISGIMLVLDNDVHIDHSFHFQSGRVRTDSNKQLIFENNASWYITNSGSFTWGPVKKIGNQTFYFPVGDSIYQRPFAMATAPAQPTDAFTGQYFHGNPSLAGYDTALHASSLSKILSREYWTFNRNNGNSKVKLEFDYDTASTGPITSPYDLRLARWNGSQWENLGLGGVQIFSNSSGRVTSDSVSSFGPLALALAPHRIPVIIIANGDSVDCAGSLKWFHFSLDTLMISNNTFKIELSDSSGSFASPVNILATLPPNSNHSDSVLSLIPSNLPGGHNYKVRIIGDAPPDTSAAKTITVKPFPNPSIVVNGPSVACYGGGVYKYWVTPVQEGIIYNWTVNNGDTLTTNNDTAYVRFGYVGFHSVAVVNANVCQSGTLAQQPVNVSYPAPTVAPVLTNTGRWLYSTAPAANQHALGYHWYRNDTLISGANNSSYYASAAGSYKVRYYNLCNDGPASNTISFTAASLPQTITFPAIPNKTYGDPDFIIPATASSGLPVSFSITSGPGTIPGNTYHITTTGVATIRATQPGDNIYDTAAPVNRTFTISKATQTITFPVISDKDFATTTQFGLNATSSSGLSILYSVLSGPAAVNGSTVTLTGLGTVTIRATQPGDTNYLAASPVDRSFCVRVSALNPISGPVSTCPTINVTYSVNNIPGATYTWRIAGGSTLPSTTNTVTHIWPSPGTYTLIASATGNCGAGSNDDSLIITAITSVSPDSVSNMLPANAATGQQLPLTLSWIPANPNLYYTYDLYLWRADTAQPAIPYASNLTNISYTIPLNSALPYGQTYKWMIAAHNGSCTVTTGGPIQTFSLIPLPDLEVYDVNAPATVLSGQPVSVTWKVKNNGPGNTQVNQQWTDAVFMSVDSVLRFTNPSIQFPGNPLLVTTKPNVTALNAGQSYNDTASFTIPVTYSGPLYMHVITNYAPPANNPVIEITKVNDTAHALPPTAVTLSPQPDLRVDTVVNPNNTFSGSTISVTFKVKNYNVNATGNWVDKIYMSKDAVFNINTATLLKYPNPYGYYYPADDLAWPHTGGLQQDSSYTVNLQAVVPNFIYGGYYVYVFTNANNDLYEGPNNNNNINHGNLMQVFLTATPKIVPQNVTVPATVSITQVAPVLWAEQNLGAFDNLQKSRGHTYVPFSFPCANTLPSYRDSLVFGSSYWIDKIYLSTDSSGLNTNTATLLNEKQWGSQNAYSTVGPRPSQYCTHIIPPEENTYPVLYPSTGLSGVYGYTIPSNLPQGDYYIYIYANPNKTVYEYPGNAQITRSNKFTVQWPDLTVPSVTVPAAGSSGQPFTINYTILNAGPGAVYNHLRKDYIYMGNSSTFNGSAVLIDSVVYPSASVPVNISQALQKVITLPNGVSGSKFIFIRANADSTFKETNLNNNINTTGAPVTITLTPPPDLQVTSIAMADTVPSVFGFPFKYTVTNTGTGLASGTWKDSIFYSCNSTFGYTNTYLIAVRTHQEYLPASASYTDSFSIVIPMTFLTNNTNCLAGDTAHVYFFVRTNANNGMYEPANANNTGGSNQKSIANPFVDHLVTNVTSADSASTGQSFKIKWTVKNIGYNPNDYTYGDIYWFDRLLISTDSVLNGNVVHLSNKIEQTRLNHNQTFTDSLNVMIPNLASGYYYLFAHANFDNRIYAERNLGNNANLRRNGSGQPIRVYITNIPAADLTDSVMTATSSVAVGQPVKVVYRVKNNGQSATNTSNWNDDLWLSNNFQPAGLFLGSRNHSGILLPGQTYIDSFTVNIPISQPVGNYTLVVKTNRDHNVYESNYNNNLAFRVISVYSPAPTDLVVNTITAGDTLVLGKSATVSWNIGNISNNPANGIETDGIYLSSDSLINSNNDFLIGTKQNQLNILPLAYAAQNSQPVTGGVTEGNYFLKVKTDIQNNIIETNKLNNTGVRGGRVYVKVTSLPMNVNVPDSLRPSYLYYKLVVPAALAGKTIQVKLTSNDSLTANNQMYIGLGYIPSAAHFDYTYSNANYGNQQIVIESVVDSVYYIAAKGTKPNAAYQLITLKAVELPFAITNVNANRGGNTGNVTVQIKGALFTNNMIARIHGVTLNNNINASAVYFVNSTTVYATFNLAGKPLGLYDVILKKPDSSAATLPSGFTIEVTNNGGLITGTGPNTGLIGSGNAPACDPGATSGLNAQLQTELIIPPKVFATWPFVIQINYTNSTNVDIPAQVKILYSLNGAPLSLTEAGLAENKTSLYIEFKDANGPANTIRAGGTGTIRVYSKAPISATAHSFLNYTFQ